LMALCCLSFYEFFPLKGHDKFCKFNPISC
jgi:hypothetical protein